MTWLARSPAAIALLVCSASAGLAGRPAPDEDLFRTPAAGKEGIAIGNPSSLYHGWSGWPAGLLLVKDYHVQWQWHGGDMDQFRIERVDNASFVNASDREYFRILVDSMPCSWVECGRDKVVQACLEARPINSGFVILWSGPCTGQVNQIFTLGGQPWATEPDFGVIIDGNTSKLCLGYDPSKCLAFSTSLVFLSLDHMRALGKKHNWEHTAVHLHNTQFLYMVWEPSIEFHMLFFRSLRATLFALVCIWSILMMSLFCRHWLAMVMLLRRLTAVAHEQLRQFVRGGVDERSARVKAIATRQRLVRGRLSINVGVLILCVMLVANVSRQKVVKDDWTCAAGTSDGGYPCDLKMLLYFLYDSEALTVCLVLPALLPFLARPTLISSWSLNVLNVYAAIAFMFQWMMTFNIHFGGAKGSYFLNWIPIARVLQCVMCGNLPLSATLQLMFSIFEQQVMEKYDPDFLANTRLNFFLIVACAAMLEVYANQTARALYQAQRLSHSESLVSKLLGGMNDAVVFLNTRMEISRPSPQLAVLMMCTSPESRHFEGNIFLDLCHPDDKERLLGLFSKDELRHEEEEEGISVYAATTRLRDVSGNFFTVELNWAYLRGEAECFLVGIREMSDGSTRAPALFVPTASGAAAGLQTSHAVTSKRSPSNKGSPSNQGSPNIIGHSSKGSPSELSSTGESPESEVSSATVSESLMPSLTMNVSDDMFAVADTGNLQIRKCSPALAFLYGGRPEGRCFTEIFVSVDKFMAWWQTVLLDLVEDQGGIRSSSSVRIASFTILCAVQDSGKKDHKNHRKKKKKKKYHQDLDYYCWYEMEVDATLISHAAINIGDLGETVMRVSSRRRLGFHIGHSGTKSTVRDV